VPDCVARLNSDICQSRPSKGRDESRVTVPHELCVLQQRRQRGRRRASWHRLPVAGAPVSSADVGSRAVCPDLRARICGARRARAPAVANSLLMLTAEALHVCGGGRGGGLSARSVRSAQAPPEPRAQQQWRRCSGAGTRPSPSETAMGWTSLVRFLVVVKWNVPSQRTGAGRRGASRLRWPSWRSVPGRQARFTQTWRVKLARDGPVALAAGVGIVFKSGPDEALFVKVGAWPGRALVANWRAAASFLWPGFASHPRFQRWAVALGMCCRLTFECGTCTWLVAARPWRTMARQPCTARSKSTTACSSACVFALLRLVRSPRVVCGGLNSAPACLRVFEIDDARFINRLLVSSSVKPRGYTATWCTQRLSLFSARLENTLIGVGAD